MTPDEELLNFLQLHPELYEIAKIPVYMAVLKAFLQQAKSIPIMQSIFSEVEPPDIEAIVFSLHTLNALSRMVVGTTEFYYLSPIGKELLEKYHKAKEALTKE